MGALVLAQAGCLVGQGRARGDAFQGALAVFPEAVDGQAHDKGQSDQAQQRLPRPLGAHGESCHSSSAGGVSTRSRAGWQALGLAGAVPMGYQGLAALRRAFFLKGAFHAAEADFAALAALSLLAGCAARDPNLVVKPLGEFGRAPGGLHPARQPVRTGRQGARCSPRATMPPCAASSPAPWPRAATAEGLRARRATIWPCTALCGNMRTADMGSCPRSCVCLRTPWDRAIPSSCTTGCPTAARASTARNLWACTSRPAQPRGRGILAARPRPWGAPRGRDRAGLLPGPCARAADAFRRRAPARGLRRSRRHRGLPRRGRLPGGHLPHRSGTCLGGAAGAPPVATCAGGCGPAASLCFTSSGRPPFRKRSPEARAVFFRGAARGWRGGARGLW